MRKKLRILVLMGGPSEEHEVSLKTGRVVANALDKDKYNIKTFVIPKKGKWKLPPKIDCVFIAMHGTFGEDGTIQAFLESQKIPYTGSGVLAAALAMDKAKSNERFAYHGLNVPRFFHFWRNDRNARMSFDKLVRHSRESGNPWIPDLVGDDKGVIVKPVAFGSSVGISLIKKRSEFKKAIKHTFSKTNHVMIQEYIAGTEVTCAVLDEGGGKEPIALPPTQIVPKHSNFFDYDAKYTPGATEEITPPRLSKKIIKEIQETALRAHKILGCAGLSRTDMIVRGNKIFILETNTIPGMTETSLYPQAARAAGMSFQALLDKLIQAGYRRYR